MFPESEVCPHFSRHLRTSSKRRILTLTGLIALANIAAVCVVWRSLAAEARDNVRDEAARLSAHYTAREIAAINGSTDAVMQRAKALQTENSELQRSLERAESEMNRLNTTLLDKVLASERIAMAIEEKQ